jgi:hypothetical protein
MRCKFHDCFNCPFPDCINDSVPATRKANPAVTKRRVQKASEIRKSRAQNGFCTNCGKNPPREGFRMCRNCQIKAARYKAKEGLRKGLIPRILMDGVVLCIKCGKNEPQQPFKSCERCLASNRAHLDLTPTHRGKKQKGNFSEQHEAFWH